MKIIDFDINNIMPEKTKGTIFTLGKFQSLHLGHQEVFSKAYNLAKEKSLDFGIMLYPDYDKSLLSLQLRIDILKQYDPKFILIFDPTPKNYSINQFQFLNWMKDRFNVKEYVFGKDFNFGKGNKDDHRIMSEYGKINVVDLVEINKQKVSTKLAALLLEEGSMQDLKKVLGFNYIYEGEVIGGLKRGRKMNFPTANIQVSKGIICPPEGIYVSYFTVRGKRYPSITSISTNPTFDTNEKLEYGTYIFDFDQVIYGEKAFVELVEFIRRPIKFDGIDKLKKQIEDDVVKAKSYLTKENNYGIS